MTRLEYFGFGIYMVFMAAVGTFFGLLFWGLDNSGAVSLFIVGALLLIVAVYCFVNIFRGEYHG